MLFAIKPLKSKRDELVRTPEQKRFIMPPPGTMIVNGPTGSGKTSIIGNLLSQPTMLKGYFDIIYLFCLSPCTTLIDNVSDLKKDNVKITEDPAELEAIYKQQQGDLERIGFKRLPHILVICDDIVQSGPFMRSSVLQDIFFGGSHSKVSLWLLTQNYMSVPRKLRMNAHSLILCHGANLQEIKRFADEHQSAYLTKGEFIDLVNYALKAPYSFLFVNNTDPDKRRKYHMGFGKVLVIQAP